MSGPDIGADTEAVERRRLRLRRLSLVLVLAALAVAAVLAARSGGPKAL